MAPRRYPVTLVEKLCSLCQTIKPAEAFGPDIRKPGGLKHACNECLRPFRTKSRLLHPLTAEQKGRKIGLANKRRGERKAAGLCAYASCGKPIGATSDIYCDGCRVLRTEAKRRDWRVNSVQMLQNAQFYRTMAQLECYDRYGGRKCACCGESELDFLSIDHINNDAYLQKKLDPAARHLALYLKANGFPPGYRVLCMNCNHGRKRSGGACPHERGSVLRLSSAC
jgi:hypothetical protein